MIHTIDDSSKPKNVFVYNKNDLHNLSFIGSIVIDNNDSTDPAKAENTFAKNSSVPISNRFYNNQQTTSNNAKQIRSTLTASAIRQGSFNPYTGKFTFIPTGDIYYLCPQSYKSVVFKTAQIGVSRESTDFCSQIPESFSDPLVPISWNSSTSTLEQNGIYLKFRKKNDLSSGWNIIYVSKDFFEIKTQTNLDGSTFEYIEFDYENILPDGDYDIEYDIALEITDDINN